MERITRMFFNSIISFQRIVALTSLMLCSWQGFAQDDASFNPAKNPVAPSIYQFLKLNEMPVDEYSGQPNIMIPIYEIETGSIVFPLTLHYQASGIKVNEEASCVGLGWTMPIGNITQVVQDRDDFATNCTRLFPDYHEGYPYPRYFPYQFDCSPAWGNYDPPTSYGITNPLYQYVVYPDFRLTFNNVYTYLPQFFEVGNGGYNAYDSEPDIFNVSVNGINLSFIIDKNMEIKVLNDIGGIYIISYVNVLSPMQGFRVLTPNGDKYFFETYTEVSNEMNHSKSIYSSGYSETDASINIDAVSRLWYLTKIIESNSNEITFSYIETNNIKNNSSISQQYKGYSLWFESDVCASTAFEFDFNSNPHSEDYTKLVSHVSSTSQKMKYCNSIEFNKGEVLLKYSSRTDIINDMKLDSLIVIDNGNSVKKVGVFDYRYNESQTVLSEYAIEEISGTRKTEAEIRNRLMLDALNINNEKYEFEYYDENEFPAKLSFSVDYWGYSNGVANNTSWIPNPIHLGIEEIPDNNEDHNANIDYTKTLTLKSLKYPTGAIQSFIYELHTFSSVFHPSIDNGFGLRIQEINVKDKITMTSQQEFTYNEGKLLTPFIYYASSEEKFLNRWMPAIFCDASGGGEKGREHIYRVNSINSSSFFSQTSFVNLRKIGYGEISHRTILNGRNFGKTKNYYANFEHNNPVSYYYENKTNLPIAPNYYQHKNGSILKSETYNEANVKIEEITTTYDSFNSELFYGAKPMHYGYYNCGGFLDPTNLTKIYFSWTKLDLVAYYPIYARESYPVMVETINWINNLPLIEKEQYQYDEKKQISEKTILLINENEPVTSLYFYPYNYPTPYSYYLISRNIIKNPIHIEKKRGNSFLESQSTTFGIFNNLILPNQIKTTMADLSTKVDYVFDAYDDKGNLLMWHTIPDFYTSRIINDKKNSIISNTTNSRLIETGHTSFENNELNGWTKYEPNEFETTPANVFTGKSSMEVTGASGPFQIFTVGQNAEKHSGYKASVWVKGESAYLHIEVNGEWSTHVKIINEFSDGLWHKLEVELPRHKIQPYFSQGENLKIKVYVGSEKGTVYFDDIRFHPSDAQMTTYTHEPLFGVTSISNENNQPIYYIYDPFGRLEYIKDFEGNILKKNDYHYRTNGQ